MKILFSIMHLLGWTTPIEVFCSASVIVDESHRKGLTVFCFIYFSYTISKNVLILTIMIFRTMYGSNFEFNWTIVSVIVVIQFYADFTEHMTSRFFTKFHYIHIMKTSEPTCTHILEDRNRFQLQLEKALWASFLRIE